MRKIPIGDLSKNAYYIREQKDADTVLSRILNEINPKEEQIFGDTETAPLPQFKHEWLNKEVFYKPGLDPLKSYVRLLQIGFRQDVYVIDTHTVQDYTLARLLLEHEDIWHWFHNAKFDYKHILWSLDIVTSNLVDFQAGAKLLNYDAANLNYLSMHYRKTALDKEVRTRDWSVDELDDRALIYAADDIVVEMDIREPMVAELKEHKLWATFFIECGALAPAGEMELNGSLVDRARHEATMIWNQKRMGDLHGEIISDIEPYLPQMALPGMRPDFNLRSRPKLLKVLQDMGLDIEATNKTELRWKAADYPITAKILELKRLDKLESSYNETVLDAIHPVTGRIHSTFDGLFTDTLRFSSSNINLQNIRRCMCKGAIHGPECCRSWFVAADGFSYLTADYAAIEMLGGAVVANETVLLDIFKRKLELIQKRKRGEEVSEFEERMADPHYRTAAIVQKINIMKVTKGGRQTAKPVNFGYLYGMWWVKFRVFAMVDYDQKFTEEEAQDSRIQFFSQAGYPGLARWHKKSKAMYKDVPVIRTLSGHELHLNYNADHDTFGGPAALNWAVQNPTAAGNKVGLAKIYKHCRPYMNKAKRFKGPMMIRTVHDENTLECPTHMNENYLRVLENGMKEGMDKIMRRDDLVSVEATAGSSWADK